jgi:hypothetical protein
MDYENLAKKKSSAIAMLDKESYLKREWNEKGFCWFNNVFDYQDYKVFGDQVLGPLETFWPHLKWHSWSNSYSNESAKAYLWTPSIIENFKVYKKKRNSTASITKDLNHYPFEFSSWLESLCGSVFNLLVKKGGVNSKDLLLIGLNINACGKNGLVFHKDTITNNGYGDVVVNLILSGGGFVVLSDSRTGNAQKHGVWLGAGDCYLISNSSRFDYFHKVTTTAIKCKNVGRNKSDVLKVEFRPEEIRMSLTLRYFYNRDRNPGEMFDIDLK